MSSPRDGYVKLSLQEDDFDGEQATDPTRNWKGCPSDKVQWPEQTSSFFSRLVFQWYAPLIKLGATTPLELSDLWHLHPTDAADANSNRFWQLWQEELERAKAAAARGGKHSEPWLGWPVFKFTWKSLAKAMFMRLSSDMLNFARPLLMQQILLVCEGSPAIVKEENAWYLAVGMAASAIAQMLLNTHYDNVINRVSFRLRCAIVGALYKKTIELSTGAKASYSSGKIVNMMSNDAMKCMQLVRQLNYAWSVPFNFIFALYLLVDLVGVAAYAGVILVTTTTPNTNSPRSGPHPPLPSLRPARVCPRCGARRRVSRGNLPSHVSRGCYPLSVLLCVCVSPGCLCHAAAHGLLDEDGREDTQSADEADRSALQRDD